MLIRINHNPPFIIILNIFEHMRTIYFCVHFNPYLNTLKLLVFEVLMFHESKDLLPTGDSSDLSTGN